MKRLHIHLAVHDLAANIAFYNALFQSQPVKVERDYAKWKLEDPRINFAISTRSANEGLDHLGLEVDSQEEFNELTQALKSSELSKGVHQEDAACCYAKSDKYWLTDPQNIAWEQFVTKDNHSSYGADTQAIGKCCVPAVDNTQGCCA